MSHAGFTYADVVKPDRSSLFNRVASGPRFGDAHGPLDTRLNDLKTIGFCWQVEICPTE